MASFTDFKNLEILNLLVRDGWEAMSPGSMVIAVEDLNGQGGMFTFREEGK